MLNCRSSVLLIETRCGVILRICHKPIIVYTLSATGLGLIPEIVVCACDPFSPQGLIKCIV